MVTSDATQFLLGPKTVTGRFPEVDQEVVRCVMHTEHVLLNPTPHTEPDPLCAGSVESVSKPSMSKLSVRKVAKDEQDKHWQAKQAKCEQPKHEKAKHEKAKHEHAKA